MNEKSIYKVPRRKDVTDVGQKAFRGLSFNNGKQVECGLSFNNGKRWNGGLQGGIARVRIYTVHPYRNISVVNFPAANSCLKVSGAGLDGGNVKLFHRPCEGLTTL